MKTYLSVPPALCKLPLPPAADFMTHDPVGRKLGSGGGTAHLLVEAWKQEAPDTAFSDWLRHNPKLLLHAGGQSRRLPAYAASGKALLPVPVFRWSTGQRLDQTLIDLQKPLLQTLLERAPASLNTLVASGDVLVWNDAPLPEIPEVDVLCVGLWDSPEAASGHGVFFTPRARPEAFEFMRQKPPPAEIQSLAGEYLFLLDVGIWLLSPRAVGVLMKKCGWTGTGFARGIPDEFDLYTHLGEALGRTPTRPDPEISTLSCAVLPLTRGEFYHFGTSRDLIRSSLALQNRVHDPRRIRSPLIKPHPSLFVQNADTGNPLSADSRDIWIENSEIGTRWTLREKHVLTGIPQNDWCLDLPPGLCLDIVPIGETRLAIRPYGFDDPFRGDIQSETTLWMGQSAPHWFAQRGIPSPQGADIQQTPLFPVLAAEDLTGEFIQWMIQAAPEPDPAHTALYQAAPKRSAEELASEANLARLTGERAARHRRTLPVLARHAHRSVFYQVDLDHTAREVTDDVLRALPPTPPDPKAQLFAYLHDRMFHSQVKRLRGEDGTPEAAQAFAALRESIIAPYRGQTSAPRNTALSDQVIWARSPVRLDLAGGWTDTPPHCFLHGGQVVNLAVELNGQPPIQVFARSCDEPRITLRSIDLGVTEHLETYDDIARYSELGSGFSIPRAALALAGFHPEFQAVTAHSTLAEQLRDFGGGIELSLLCAVPKGSGLGTSSILAATVLGALSELCGLRWDLTEIGNRTLALEQMLTSGGGWQDQFGGITRGLKLLRTRPGLLQTPEIRWLPDHLFTDPAHSGCILLYYTGITRVAKNLLGEIVRGMFLNRQQVLHTLDALDHHADDMYEALQKGDFAAVGQNVRRTWELNQRLDPGTNPPEVQAILAPIDDCLHGMKLLGAGGGGYLLLLAKSPEDAARVRTRLRENPPNPRARFVDVSLSRTGLQITRS
ncbi:MAG: bifunctional fucokinase/L-fucose-1-P-guanylyltransferase [Verrucomicrobia bacterium]|nr:bifunctional fucokinase/L-fucose-1-P-guanylyltransferase [Verrucomicrobiota bacterium]MCH8526907.1 bifunctional fucokinase/L-fucose-1-P-guanylyltransferase [Kiritimatiellia bacterium]